MGLVTVQLGALVLGHRILDGQRVQPQFLADRGQVVRGRLAEVEPDDRRRVGEVVRHFGDREPLVFQGPIAVHAGTPRGGQDTATCARRRCRTAEPPAPRAAPRPAPRGLRRSRTLAAAPRRAGAGWHDRA
jgi:hypothetical protein